MSADYERVVLVKGEAFVFKIPPLGTNRGYKAADWKLDNPDFVGRLRAIALGDQLELRIEEKATGNLFAKCPVDSYPGAAVEAVLDSSRYFVLRLRGDDGRTAFVGLGFADRGDSFDFNVALQDHFKGITRDAKLVEDEVRNADQPKLDLGFKDGQTIKINIGSKKEGAPSRQRPSAGASAGGGAVPLLPPPPGAGSTAAAAPRLNPPASSAKSSATPSSALNDLLDL